MYILIISTRFSQIKVLRVSSPRPGQNGGKIIGDDFKYNFVNEHWFYFDIYLLVCLLGVMDKKLWLCSNDGLVTQFMNAYKIH